MKKIISYNCDSCLSKVVMLYRKFAQKFVQKKRKRQKK